MKKYLIHFMTVDVNSIEDEGVSSGTNFGIYGKTFNTREEAEKGLEKLMAEDKASLELEYDLEDENVRSAFEIKIENGKHDWKELTVYEKWDEYKNAINTTIYEIVEVEF